jgi:hypothetical protein
MGEEGTQDNDGRPLEKLQLESITDRRLTETASTQKLSQNVLKELVFL